MAARTPPLAPPEPALPGGGAPAPTSASPGAVSRYFVALRPGQRARAALGAFARDLAGRFGGRAVAPADIHLTLAFIGQAPRSAEHAIAGAVAALPRPGTLALARVGSFDGRLLWLAPPEPAQPWLAQLAAELRVQLEGIEVAFDRKRFRPHVTLVRGARGADRDALAQIPVPAAAGAFGQGRAWLVESTLLPSGSRYRWVEAPASTRGEGVNAA